MTKDLVLEALRRHPDRFVSGEELASGLSLSRTAVWKAVEQLRGDGWRIESGPRRGYRLSCSNDVLSSEGIRQYLKSKDLDLRYLRSVGSTNTVLKNLAAEGLPEGTALVAGEQTQGRGRMGRSFYSPGGSGLYMSLLLRPTLPASEATGITACAAVAVAETLEQLSGRPTQIKWVNDIWMEGKKVCGILTEASIDCESGRVHDAVVGIGINVRAPEGGFPEDLEQIAGAVFPEQGIPDLRCQVAAGVLDRLWSRYRAMPEEDCFSAYRARSLVLGKDVDLLTPGQAPIKARVLDLARDYSLLVRLESGEQRQIRSGEIRIRPRKE